MIIDSNLIAYDFVSDFNGISRQYPYKQSESGLSDAQKPVYKYGPESSEYPTLLLPINLYDEWGNVIPDGFYMVVLSDDFKYLDLYQSNRLKAKVKVIKYSDRMYTHEELDEEAAIIQRLEEAKAKRKLKKIKKAEEDLIAFKEKRAANSFAKIEDSGKGYYILRYNHNGKKATGIIQK